MAIEIGLWGPLEVRDGTGVLRVGSGLRPAALALLALELGRPVPVERFLAVLWGEQPPAQAKAALQAHISMLRRLLDGSDFEILTQTSSYTLTGPADAVDTHRFARLLARARVAEPAQARELYRSALDLCRGTPLDGLSQTPAVRELVEAIERDRLDALDGWMESELRVGDGGAALPALRQALQANPLRESSAVLLVRALHRAGRTAEAHDVYERTRHLLWNESGLEPGARLREAHQAAVDAQGRAGRPEQQPVGDSAPRQLPRDIASFVGRAAELDALERTCGPGRLAMLTGPAGAGKTVLALRWAHSRVGDFPDGQLFLDLRGFDPISPVGPLDALQRMLRALGVTDREMPATAAACADLFRQLSWDRRLLVVLDNAADHAHVRDLLPSGPHCATLITSRNTLEELIVSHGAAMVSVGMLPFGDAVALLQLSLGEDRVYAEPAMTERLITLCDQLPLALRIAAARLASRPGWHIAHLVDALADERDRLESLNTHGGVGVTAALNLTRRHLHADAVRLLRLLALHQGSEIDTWTAAALLGTDLQGARRALGALAAYSLTWESGYGLHARHDLVRLYCAELLVDECSPTEQSAAALRLGDYYLDAMRAADRARGATASPGYDSDRPPAGGTPSFAARDRIEPWFRREETVIRALVTGSGVPPAVDLTEHCWRLAVNSVGLYLMSGNLPSLTAVLDCGMVAAEKSGSLVGQAYLATARGISTGIAGDPPRALEWHRKAAALATASGEHAVCTMAMGCLAGSLSGQGRWQEALLVAEQELFHARALERADLIVLALANVGEGLILAGRLEEALERVSEGLRLYRTEVAPTLTVTPNWYPRLRRGHIRALSAVGRAEEAVRACQELLAEDAGLDNRAMTTELLGDVLASAGRRPEAAEAWRASREVRELQQASTVELDERLASISAEAE